MNLPETTLTTGAALFGVDPNLLKPLGGSDGAVYACRRGNRAAIIKFVPMPADRLGAYAEKQAFIRYLAENGVPLAAPLESGNGRLYETLPAADGLYVVALTELAGGRHPTPRNLYDWNERLFTCWGQVLGRMHALARAYPHWQKSETSQIHDWQSEHAHVADWCKEPKVTAQWHRLYEPLAALPRERDGFGLIHNDLHMWNFLYDPDTRGRSPITIIDFDVCAYHWFITDIAIAVYHGMTFGARKSIAERETFARQFLRPFLGGYRQENELDMGWFEYLPLFLRYREILSYIALSDEWPEAKRAPWQNAMLAEKKSRILRGEALIRAL